MDPDEWCRERQVEFPQDLIRAPPDAVGKTTVQPTDASRILYASILMTFATVLLAISFLLQK